MSTSESTQGHENHCLRCGRKLTASTGYGPVCLRKIRAAAIAEARADFTPEQCDKADEMIRDGGMVPTGRKGVFTSVSSKGDATYKTHKAACNCPAGLRCTRAVAEQRTRSDGRTVTVRPCYHVLVARVLAIASRRTLAKAA